MARDVAQHLRPVDRPQGGPKGTERNLWKAIDAALSNGVEGQSLQLRADNVTPNQTVQPVASNLLIDLQLEKPYAIPWLITVQAMQYQPPPSGAASGLVAGFPADNQVHTGEGSSAATIPYEPTGVKLDLEWGSALTETATIDYPWGGLTLVLQGRTIKVKPVQSYLVAGDPLIPIVGAWATPAMGARGGPAERTGPTFTTRLVDIPTPGDSHVFAIPRRSVGYRIFSDLPNNNPPPGTASGYQAQAQQENVAGTVWCVDYDGTFGLAGINDPDSASRWWPLHPNAEVVRVINPVALAADMSVGVQFKIDLG